MQSIQVKLFGLFCILFGVIACQPDQLIELPSVQEPETFTPYEDDLLGPCGKQAGTVYDWNCGLVLVADNGEIYELDRTSGFQPSQRLSYQVLGEQTTLTTECANILSVQFGCIEQL